MDHEFFRNIDKQLKGKRIRCIEMMPDALTGIPEPNPIPRGTEGEIMSIDDAGTIHVKWDNGRSLGIIYGFDKYDIISDVKIHTRCADGLFIDCARYYSLGCSDCPMYK